MTGYQFGLTCPKCGHRMVHTADGATTARHTCALAECTHCRAVWRIDVRLACVREPNGQPPMGEPAPVWDETAPMAGLIRLLLQVEDELGQVRLSCRNGSADRAETVAEEARRG